MNSQVAIIKKQFDLSWEMLESLIRLCPEDLWREKRGGFIVWQQIVHALAGVRFWLRGPGRGFMEPFPGRDVFPELDGRPKINLTRLEVGEYAKETSEQVDDFFRDRDDAWLAERCAAAGQMTNLDVVAGQLRHIMYHAGHLDAILRQEGRPASEWRE